MKERAKDQMPAKEIRMPEAEDPSDESIALSGAFSERLDQIRTSNAGLILAPGKGGRGQDVLVPMMDWQVHGKKMAEAETLAPEAAGDQVHSSLLTFENFAFLIQDLSHDVRDAVRILALQAKGGIAPPVSGMRYSADMLRLACEHMSHAADQIEAELLGSADVQVKD